jgi:Bacterial protein of unknown function (DUF916)
MLRVHLSDIKHLQNKAYCLYFLLTHLNKHLEVTEVSLRKSASALIGVLFFFVVTITPLANAQQGGNGLQLSPTRTDITASPGEVKPVNITIKNVTQVDFDVKTVINDFESDGESGAPKFLVDSNDRTPYSISSMVDGLSDVSLKAGETKEVKLTLDVPANVAPGAYYGAVRFSVAPKSGATDAERQIALNASVAHLVFLEVPGDVVQQISIDSLKFVASGVNEKERTIFFNKKPEIARVKVENLGNGLSRPFGTVTVTGPFKKQTASMEVNDRETRSVVLPKSTRVYTVPEDAAKNPSALGVKLPGRYSVTASIAYGNGGEVVNYSASFWYLPFWFLITLFVLVVVLIVGGYVVYRKYFGAKALTRKK